MTSPFTTSSKRVCTVLLAFLLVGQISSSQAKNQTDLQKLRQQIEQIQQDLQHKSQRKSRSEKQLERSERQISRTSRQLTQLKQEIQEARQESQRLRAQRAEILAESQDHRQDLKTQVRAHYLMGRNHHLKLLLDQQDSSKLGRSLVYYNYFNQRRNQVLGALDNEITRLKALEDALSRSQETLQRKREKLKQRRSELKQQQSEQQQLVKQLERELSKDNKRLKKLQADEQRLSKLTGQIYQSVTKELPNLDEDKPFPKLKGRLPWPVKGKVENRYGSQRSKGGLRWNGILIRANEGTPVRAVAGGRIVFANWLRGYGFLIIVDHGRGYMSLYGHNRQLFKEVGETVAKGDMLAQVGNSGGREENALYFEIRRNGKTLNPSRWIAKR